MNFKNRKLGGMLLGIVAIFGLLFLRSKSGNIIEGFGQGAQAQISSNRDDNTLFGSGGGDPMAANEFGTGGGMYSSMSQGLQPTTSQEYQSMTGGRGLGYGNTGTPNYGGHRPVRPHHQPEFTPEIQNQFIRYERALAAERRKNAMLGGRSSGIGSLFNFRFDSRGLIGQLLNFIEQLFRFVLGILNILIGWLF
jgi:hypothetical protein